jgi:uncharacterized protein (DUF3084 family)
LRSQLETEKTRSDDASKELDDREAEVAKLRSDLETLRTDRPEIQESVPVAADFPEPADILNQLKGKRKKSTVTLADIETILEILES